jgi:bifunctional oligoribonuclease and PAP phosphatase NrnA
VAKRLSDPAAERAKSALESCKHPLICSHVRLDGDAIGSELGLYHILRAMNKAPVVANGGPVPRAFLFLPGANRVVTDPAALGEDYDLLVVLDSPNMGRLEGIAERWPKGLRGLNIDHHATNDRYLDVNWIDGAASSTGEMLFDLAVEAGWTVPVPAATSLYVAIITDTNRFTLPHTSSHCLADAAQLIDLGAAHVDAAEHLYYSMHPGLARLRGMCLATIRLRGGGRVATARLTLDMFRQTGTEPQDTQEFAEIPRSVEGVVAGALLREMEDRKVKISLRCRDGYDVESVAQRFGGGGHMQAAGATAEGNLDNVEQAVVAEIELMIARVEGGRHGAVR